MDAAVRLSADGTTPSVDDIAAARRTVYKYFPSLDHLLIDASAGAFNESPVEEAPADPALAGDAGRDGKEVLHRGDRDGVSRILADLKSCC
ncbi:hypothetical protein [Nonomuraea sp. NPDC001023]|uniref:hypothetical protein n=1 Tax=unclassified Nonomuraea TaxID=2593643 RepID=UPI00331E6F27